MRLTTLCGRLSRDAYCHAPADTPFDPSALITSDEPERWSEPGEPTIYLAGDPGVALAEFGRHRPRLPRQSERRAIVRVHVSLDRVVDLTRRETLDALSIEGPWVFTERERAREVARIVRGSGDCDAMVVPSIAFLDRLERWNLVVFADRLDAGFRDAIGSPTPVGEVRFGREVVGAGEVSRRAMVDEPSEGGDA